MGDRGAPVLIDTHEAAALLGVTPEAVRGLANRGRLTRRGTARRQARYGRPRALYDRAEVVALATRRAA